LQNGQVVRLLPHAALRENLQECAVRQQTTLHASADLACAQQPSIVKQKVSDS
jgi:hypothetical protein